MYKSIAVAVAVCGLAAPARADDRAAKLAKLMTAIKHHDTKAFTQLVVAPFEVSPPAWRSAACEKEFHAVLDHVVPARFGKLVVCLDELDLTPSTDAVQFFTYEPGGLLNIAFDLRDPNDEKPSGIMAKRDGDTPVVEREAFVQHLNGAFEVPGDAAIAAAVKKWPDARAVAAVVACFDATGKADSVVIEASNAKLDPAVAGYPKLVEAAVRGWTVKPFTVKGKPVRACMHERLSYPATSWSLAPGNDVITDQEAQFGIEAVGGVRIDWKYLERVRVAGTLTVSASELAHIANPDAIAMYHVCVDANGAVAKVTPEIAPQAAGYDALLVAKIRAWRFKPFLYDGKPTPACTMYDFQLPAH